MSKCQCDLRTKLVGDGCRYCNAQEYIDKLIEALEEQRTWVGLTDEHKEGLICMTDPNPEPHHLRELIDVVEFQLKEKNCSL